MYDKTEPTSRPIDEVALFSFVPHVVPHVNCDDLFQGNSPAALQFPTEYTDVSRLIEDELNRLKAKKVIMEGHSGQMEKQTLTYQTLAKTSFVKTVCETGFNAGHSALLFLSTKADIHVYSFDLGVHPYGRPSVDLLQKTFPGRLNVTWGDSKVTVPAFAKYHPNIKCDIVIVDGGHNYREAKADLRNLRAMAQTSYNFLIIDDHPSDTLPGVKKAWEEELSANQLQEHFRCNFHSDTRRGFTVAKYINL